MSKKRKIFIFWLNEKIDIKKTLEKKFEKFNGKLIYEVGPTSDEHNFLMTESLYYKNAFEKGFFAFCSDVWRIYKLSKEEGLFLDVSTVVGDNLLEFYDKNIKKEVTLFKGNPYLIETGVMFSGKKNNLFFKKIFDYYKQDLDIFTSFFGPCVLTKFVNEIYGYTPSWEIDTYDKLNLLPLLDIRDKKTVWKTGGGSWSFNKDYLNFEKDDSWSNWEKKWNNRKIEKRSIKRYKRFVELDEKIDVHMLRKYFDITKNKSTRKHLKKQYKKIKTKLYFDERLIWSKMFIPFGRNKKDI